MRPILILVLVVILPAIATGEPLQEKWPHSYELTSDSFYEEGCYDPCLCPIFLGDDLDGRFVLVPRGVEDGFLVHSISSVSLKVFGQHGLTATGAGTYRISTGRPRLQRMELDLSLDGGEPERFDSGLVPAGYPFPEINITVSMNGMYCWDTVFSIRSAPRRFPGGAARDRVLGVFRSPDQDTQPTTWGRIKSLYP